MVLAILLMLLGAGVVLAGLQWRSGQWLESARWVMRRISPHAVVGMPAVGVMVLSLGLMLIWPVAVLLAFGAATAWIWVMAKSAETGARGRLPRELIERPGTTGPASAPDQARQVSRPDRSGQRSSARRARLQGRLPEERGHPGQGQAINRRAG